MRLTSSSRLGRILLSSVLAIAAAGLVVTSPSRAWAQDTEAQKEANIHFQRAVGLYAEADYRAALVEFKRAYEIAPHVTVLYNLGQTYYQLQNYAEALTTFERFLAEGGTAHRSEVENAVNVLKSRVGKLDITTASPGWEILIDDEAVGKTPLARPIGVSVGKRRITVTKAGEANQSRIVEVAAGETAAVSFTGSGSSGAGTALSSDQPGPSTDKGGNTLLVVGWVATGALAAGAVVTGILAASAASDLDDARNKFPGNAADIDDKASTTTTLSITTDILAGAAIILGGVSLYFTLTSDKGAKKATAPAPSGVRLGGGAGRFVLGGTF